MLVRPDHADDVDTVRANVDDRRARDADGIDVTARQDRTGNRLTHMLLPHDRTIG